MPGFNGNGPEGQGPMTGRGQGRCTGNNIFGNGAPYGQGRGYGCRNGLGAKRGGGRGRSFQWGGQQNTLASQGDETAVLENQARQLKTSLDQIQQRLEELKKTE